MAYKKQNFVDNETVLKAEHLDHIEGGIIQNETNLNALRNMLSVARIGYVTLLADKWEGEASPYSQRVTLDGVTAKSQVDLTPSVAQLAVFHQKDLAFVTENDGGIVTVYAIGQKPVMDYTIQVTMTEVSV